MSKDERREDDSQVELIKQCVRRLHTIGGLNARNITSKFYYNELKEIVLQLPLPSTRFFYQLRLWERTDILTITDTRLRKEMTELKTLRADIYEIPEGEITVNNMPLLPSLQRIVVDDPILRVFFDPLVIYEYEQALK